MLECEVAYEDGRCSLEAFRLPLLIGRSLECGLTLKSWRVARQHARILSRGGTVFVEDLGSLGGTFVNGRRVAEYGPLGMGDEIIIGPCRMLLTRLPATERRVVEPEASGSGAVWQSAHDDAVDPPSSPSSSGSHDHLVSPANDDTGTSTYPALSDEGAAIMREPATDTSGHHRNRLHKALLAALDLRRRDILALSDDALKAEATNVLAGILKDDTQLPPDIDRADILKQVVDEAVGLGPLEPLLADRTVTEIMVNSHAEIYVERQGRLHRHSAGFSSEHAVLSVIDRIVAPLGRRVDESSPMVDARLKDGSRVNAVIPPIALRGACLTIRKFPERRLEMRDLLQVGSLDARMAAFLTACVAARKSILVSGGTGSGKTTLLNVLSNCIPAGERIVTIEDAAELRLNHAHLIALESRPANAEGKGRVDIRDLVRNALRMRPDRIIVGECRGAEAFDMLAAMNTGHEGSLTTLHANTPRDALARLETMVLMAGMDLPLTAIREHIASAVDLIVQQARLTEGRRLVTSIVEVTGMEAGRIQTQELFRYRHHPEPAFESCGVQPECLRSDELAGIGGWMPEEAPLMNHSAGLSWPL